jgi:hypothetical protein
VLRVKIERQRQDRDQMNLYILYSFLPFYTCEDTAVLARGRLTPTAMAIAGAAAVPGSCLKW